jgi:hypothetical protein
MRAIRFRPVIRTTRRCYVRAAMWTPLRTLETASDARRRGALLAACVACFGLTVSETAAAGTSRVTENVKLTLVKKSGSAFTHRGSVTGSVPGSASARTTLKGLSLSGVVSIRTSHGTLRITIRGTARSNGLRSKFDGSATMSGGTGRYKHARGTGRFEGVVNRSTWAATIRATGSLTT